MLGEGGYFRQAYICRKEGNVTPRYGFSFKINEAESNDFPFSNAIPPPITDLQAVN